MSYSGSNVDYHFLRRKTEPDDVAMAGRIAGRLLDDYKFGCKFFLMVFRDRGVALPPYEWVHKNIVGVAIPQREWQRAHAWIVSALLQGHVVFRTVGRRGDGFGQGLKHGDYREDVRAWLRKRFYSPRFN
jgi:hypothetical protein